MSKKYIYTSVFWGIITLIALAIISISPVIKFKYVHQLVFTFFFLLQCYHGFSNEIKYCNYLRTKMLADDSSQEIKDILVTYPQYKKALNIELRLVIVFLILSFIVCFLSFMFFKAYNLFIFSHLTEISCIFFLTIVFLYLAFRERYILSLGREIIKKHYKMKIRRNIKISYPENKLISFRESQSFEILVPNYNCVISCIDIYEKEKTFTNNYTTTGYNLSKKILRYHYKLNNYTNLHAIIDKGFNEYELNRLPIELKPAYDELRKTRIMKLTIDKDQIKIDRCIKMSSFVSFNSRKDVEDQLNDVKIFYDKIVQIIENTNK